MGYWVWRVAVWNGAVRSGRRAKAPALRGQQEQPDADLLRRGRVSVVAQPQLWRRGDSVEGHGHRQRRQFVREPGAGHHGSALPMERDRDAVSESALHRSRAHWVVGSAVPREEVLAVVWE